MDKILKKVYQVSEDAFGGSLGDNDPIMPNQKQELNDLQKINSVTKELPQPSQPFFNWLENITSKEKGKSFFDWLK